MSIKLVISYDGTENDDDALTLGRMLGAAGASLSLAYVRHAREHDPHREQLDVDDAARRLQQGAHWLGNGTIARHIVVDPSTSAGLAALASSMHAAAVIFGSDYRTAPGRVQPGASAQGLLDGGSVAVGVAAAGLHARSDRALRTISFSGDGAAGTAADTAAALAVASGAELVPGARDADLIVVDSRESAPDGMVGLDGVTRGWLDGARGSVLVLPRGGALAF
ncbi:MAG TPA: hypothetical protein VFW09_08675 [Solirubrobacteraceae bacterium]|nr:hypothetical protein [Solirubrobacteraceae bacterium]